MTSVLSFFAGAALVALAWFLSDRKRKNEPVPLSQIVAERRSADDEPTVEILEKEVPAPGGCLWKRKGWVTA